MLLYRVNIQRLLAFDETTGAELEAGKTARCAIITGPGVSKEVAEKFGRASLRRGVNIDIFTEQEAPQLLFSKASQQAMEAAKANPRLRALPVIAEDVSKFYDVVCNLTLQGEELAVFEYTPGEDWTKSFSW